MILNPDGNLDGRRVLYYAEEQIVRPSSHTTDVVDGTLQVRCDQAFNIQDPRQQDSPTDGTTSEGGGGELKEVLASDGIGEGWVLLLGGVRLMPCRLAWPLALEGTHLQRACSVLCTKPDRPTTSSINHPSTRPRSTFHRPHTTHHTRPRPRPLVVRSSLASSSHATSIANSHSISSPSSRSAASDKSGGRL